MKICPKCQTKYDEDIIKFCTKDGTPLIEENPTFTAMPSQSSIDDIGEETLITINRPTMPPPAPVVEPAEEAGARVVIPIGSEKQQAVRPKDNPNYQQPAPRKSNTALIVFLTIFGTVGILGAVVGGWWLLSGGNGATANTNTNSNVAANNSNQNVNSNLGEFNIGNANTNSNANSNVNSNVNVNKPTPTKTPTPTPSNTNTNVNANQGVNFNSTIINISPSNTNNSNRPSTPTPTETPKPTPTRPANTPSNVNVGIMNSRASSLAKPAYPPMAKQMGAAGQVVVQISVDENGNVLSARAISGHSLLRNSAELAARQSRFNPVKIDDRPVRANGTLVYNFINQ